MLNYAYANFSGYFWLAVVAVITYFVMTIVKRTFTPLTKKLASNDKERRFINMLLGVVLSIAVGLSLGKIGNLLFGTNIHFMWFVAGGALANYVNLIVRKYKDADSAAFAQAFIKAMNESNMDVSEADLPVLTEQITEIVQAYAKSNENSRTSKLRGVASGITNSVEITDDEKRELERAIERLKSSGIDTTIIEQAYARAKADGKVTVAEKTNLEAVIRAIHQATNI